LGSFGVAAGGNANREGGDRNAVVIVNLQRSVVAVGPLPTTILALDGPHDVEHFARYVAELARGL